MANYRIRIGHTTSYPLLAEAGSYLLSGQNANLSFTSLTNNSARIISGLNGYTVPFSYNAPADPVTTSSATVTPATLAANIVAGRQLTLQAGSYGSVTWNVNDLDIICQAGVSFTGMTFSGSRVRITGGGGTTVTGLLWAQGAPTDLMIDNIFIVNGTGPFESVVVDSVARVCFKNVSINTTGDTWGLITELGEDLIIVNSDFELSSTFGSRAPLRISGGTRRIIVNNRLAGNQAGPRFNNQSAAAMVDLCVANNQFEATNAGPQIRSFNGGGGNGIIMNRGWFVNNSVYHPGQSQSFDIGASFPEDIQNYVVTGNRAYNAATNGSAATTIAVGAGSSASDNLNQTYVSPPAFSGGAT